MLDWPVALCRDTTAAVAPDLPITPLCGLGRRACLLGAHRPTDRSFTDAVVNELTEWFQATRFLPLVARSKQFDGHMISRAGHTLLT
jgi:hypothetical protein